MHGAARSMSTDWHHWKIISASFQSGFSEDNRFQQLGYFILVLFPIPRTINFFETVFAILNLK